jgi:hypothetical protein
MTICEQFNEDVGESVGSVPISFSTKRLPSNLAVNSIPVTALLNVPRRAATVAPVTGER